LTTTWGLPSGDFSEAGLSNGGKQENRKRGTGIEQREDDKGRCYIG